MVFMILNIWDRFLYGKNQICSRTQIFLTDTCLLWFRHWVFLNKQQPITKNKVFCYDRNWNWDYQKKPPRTPKLTYKLFPYRNIKTDLIVGRQNWTFEAFYVFIPFQCFIDINKHVSDINLFSFLTFLYLPVIKTLRICSVQFN